VVLLVVLMPVLLPVLGRLQMLAGILIESRPAREQPVLLMRIRLSVERKPLPF
jgi:hypothetical protein